jgi:hypothetical protein
MADDEYTYTPPVQRGLDTGEYIVNIPPSGADQIIAPPMQRAIEEEIVPAARGAGSALTLGQLPRAIGAANYVLGNDPSYSAGVDRYVKSDQEAARRSPLAYGLGAASTGVLGGIGLARAGVTSVPYLASRFGRMGSVLGNVGEAGVLGGVQGAGSTYTSKPEDYFANAGWGAATAAPFGLVGAASGATGESVYRGMASTRGIPARLAEAGATDAAGLQEIISGARGPRAMLPDAGPAMLGTAQGAVLDPLRQGPADLLRNLRARNETSAPYIDQSLNRIYGTAPVPSHVQRDIVDPQIAALSPRYRAAYSQGHAVDTQPIANWLETEIINSTGEARSQLQRIRNDLNLHGVPDTLDQHPRKLGAVRSDINGLLRTEDLKPGTLQPNTVRLLEEADRRMTAELQAKVPGLRDLDAMRAELGQQERALGTRSAGSRMFDTGRETVIRPAELQDIMQTAAVPKGSMTYTEEPLRLRQAARAELDRIVGTKKNDLLALENVLANPQDYNSQKLAIMFGQDRADQIAGVLRNERIGRESYQKIGEGSQTATREASMKAQDAQAGKLPLSLTPTGAITRAASWAKDQLFQAQAAAQRDRIAGFMASMNPAEVQAAARQLLAVQPDRNARSALVRTMMQGGGRGASAGFVPKEYRTE